MTQELGHARRFLIIAPLGRDAELISSLLNGSGYGTQCLKRIGDISENSDVLGLILTDEALARDGLECLRTLMRAQPQWSDLPIVLLTSGPTEPQLAAMASQIRTEIRSLFLLDRPVRMETLISAAQVAYNSRMRQLEVRDAAVKQFQSDEALRNTEKLAITGRLAATLAHEVNNPLEALGNLLFLVENSATIEEARPLCRLASQELQRISEIVNHTLRFHRASGSPDFCDLYEVAESALALFRIKLSENRIHAEISGSKTVAYVSGGEVRQAIVNLIGNAVDAMPNGGHLLVRISSTRSYVHGTKYARVSVADTGIGIPISIRPNLFSQFFTTKGSRGTGLGLWLTRDIVLRNRGQMRFRSRTAHPSGTVFTIYLPTRPMLDVVQSPSAGDKPQHSVAGAA